jgi:hypothetical protein
MSKSYSIFSNILENLISKREEAEREREELEYNERQQQDNRENWVLLLEN